MGLRKTQALPSTFGRGTNPSKAIEAILWTLSNHCSRGSGRISAPATGHSAHPLGLPLLPFVCPSRSTTLLHKLLFTTRHLRRLLRTQLEYGVVAIL